MKKKIKYVFIRHAEKEFNNNRGPDGAFQHDPPLKESLLHITERMGRKLLNNIGVPNMIIMSPYLRVRQTVNMLGKNHDFSQLYYVDTNLAEYLGNQSINIHVSPSTIYHSTVDDKLVLPNTRENKEMLMDRVRNHIDTIHILDDYIANKVEEDKIIWIVTHGIVIQYIHEILKQNNIENIMSSEFYPSYLCGFIVTKDISNSTIEYIR